MTPRLALDNYYVTVSSLSAAILIIIYCASLYQEAKKTKLLEYFLLTMSMVLLWLVSKLFKTASPDVNIRWLFIVTQYLGICLLNYYFVQFSWVFAYDRPMKRRQQALFLLPMLFSFVMIATNPFHMLFYSKYNLFRDSFGPLFYPHQALSYLYLAYGVYLCTKEYKNSFYMKYLQSRIFAVAIFIPIIINIMYVAKLLKKAFGIRLPMDITPLAVMISLGLFSVAIKRYRFLDITPLAYKEALKHADKAIAVFDTYGQLQDANDKFNAYLNTKTNFSALDEKYNETQILSLFTESKFEHQHFKIKDKKDSTIGFVHEWTDQTQIQNAIEALENNNNIISDFNKSLSLQGEKLREMERIQTTNRVSRDLHDVLGNTLVLTKTTLETINSTLDEPSKNPLALVENAKNLIHAGIDQLSEVVSHSTQKTPNSLTVLLDKFSAQFQNTAVHLNINFFDSLHQALESKADEIFAIIRESVTNALRHGDAKDIYIIYRNNREFSEFHIIDNGRGCKEIQTGMGLKGMKERADLIQGEIEYNNIAEGGFKVTLKLFNEHL